MLSIWKTNVEGSTGWKEVSDTARRLVLLAIRIIDFRPVLTPQDNDPKPGIWIRARRSLLNDSIQRS
jgi:hypothetical protein